MAANEHLSTQQFGAYLDTPTLLKKALISPLAGGNTGIPNTLGRPTSTRLRSSRAWNSVDTVRESYARGYRVPN